MSSNIKIYVSRGMVFPYIFVGMLTPMALANSGVSFLIVAIFIAFLTAVFFIVFMKSKKKVLWEDGEYVFFNNSGVVDKVLKSNVECINCDINNQGEFLIRVVTRTEGKFIIPLPHSMSRTEFEEVEKQINEYSFYNNK